MTPADKATKRIFVIPPDVREYLDRLKVPYLQWARVVDKYGVALSESQIESAREQGIDLEDYARANYRIQRSTHGKPPE